MIIAKNMSLLLIALFFTAAHGFTKATTGAAADCSAEIEKLHAVEKAMKEKDMETIDIIEKLEMKITDLEERLEQAAAILPVEPSKPSEDSEETDPALPAEPAPAPAPAINPEDLKGSCELIATMKMSAGAALPEADQMAFYAAQDQACLACMQTYDDPADEMAVMGICLEDGKEGPCSMAELGGLTTMMANPDPSSLVSTMEGNPGCYYCVFKKGVANAFDCLGV